MLQNADRPTLSVRQIAAHLNTAPSTVTYELKRAAAGQPGRLRGSKKRGEPGTVGRGGQWRVERDVYLDWLGIPAEDRDRLGADGLPELHTEQRAAELLDVPQSQLSAILLRGHAPCIAVAWRRYLTHNQLERLRVLLAEDHRASAR